MCGFSSYSVCMTGTVAAQANFAVIITDGVSPLTRQTVRLWTERTFRVIGKGSQLCCHSFAKDDRRRDLCSLDEMLHRGFLVLLVSSPGSEGRRLQGSAKGEGQDPGFGQGTVVDGVEVDRGLLFTLAA